MIIKAWVCCDARCLLKTPVYSEVAGRLIGYIVEADLVSEHPPYVTATVLGMVDLSELARAIFLGDPGRGIEPWRAGTVNHLIPPVRSVESSR